MDEPVAEPIDPSFFDFDNGDPLGKEELKSISILPAIILLHLTDLFQALIYEEITRVDNARASLSHTGP